MGLTIDHVSDATAAGALGNVHLAIYRGALTLEELDAVHAAHEALRARHPRTCVLSVAAPGMPLPDGEVRARASAMGREMSPGMIASAQIVSGTGFWVSAARSALTAILWLQGGQFPARAFDDVGDACAWIATRNPGGPTPGDLAAALHRLRDAPV